MARAPSADPEHHAETSRLGALALVPIALFATALYAFLTERLPLHVSWPWVPSLGIELSFHLDALALQLVLMITGVGALVMIYGAGYLAGDPKRHRLYLLLFLFMAAMLGCVTADDLVVLFLFWETTSLTSFALVGTKHEKEASRASAQQALIVTASGGLALLAGILLLGLTAGTFSIQELVRTAPSWLDDPRVTPALLCIFLGALTKSAQFPFHFWLPNAMAAPTPVSAYLHSATMVKLGVYLLARLHPIFGELSVWQITLVSVGGFTSVWSMILVVRESDLKRILAWSTVSALGTLVLMIGLPGVGAATAVAAFLLAHALYKAPLFFVAGNVDHATGTRDVRELAGLARSMPYTAAAALMAGLSMAGIPLSFGFVAKDLVKVAKEEAEVYTWVAYSGVLVSAASIAVAAVAAVRVFWHRGGKPVPTDVHEGPLTMRLPPVMLAGLGIVLGVLPWLVDPLVVASARDMRPNLDFTGIDRIETTPTFTALASTVALGLVLFVLWDRVRALSTRLPSPTLLSMLGWYQTVLKGIPKVAGAVTRSVQHGVLRGYVAMVVAFIVGGIGLALVFTGGPERFTLEVPSLAVGAAVGVIVLAAVLACVVRDSFVMLLVSGVIGLGSALIFLFLGAPDVAFTQFAVEVAFVVVIASILLRVRRLELTPPPEQAAWPRALLAIAAGGVVAVLCGMAGEGVADPALIEYFGARSVPDAHGSNVVNVILVDFRAVDTLGEISVVAATFVAALPLLAALRRRGGVRS
jgi:multicomponent Na+:H+ antiporter subunit A